MFDKTLGQITYEQEASSLLSMGFRRLAWEKLPANIKAGWEANPKIRGRDELFSLKKDEFDFAFNMADKMAVGDVLEEFRRFILPAA